MRIVSAAARQARRFLARRNAVVLTYHCIRRDRAAFPVWQHLDAGQFDAHMAYVARSFRCVQVSRLIECAAQGEVPPNTVAITFDDGFANNLHVALPILERYQVPATIVLAAGYIDRDCVLWPEYIVIALAATRMERFTFDGETFDLCSVESKAASYRTLARKCKHIPIAEQRGFLESLARALGVSDPDVRAHPLWEPLRIMSWNEVKELAQSSLIEIGAHTLTHPVLNRLSDDEARREIAGSKALIEKHVGPVKLFAYPYGGDQDYSSRHAHMAREAGYAGALSSTAGTVLPGVDPFEVPRYGVGDACTLDELRYQLNGGLAFATGGARWL